MKYRKKPVVVDAFQLKMGMGSEDWFWDAVDRNEIMIYEYKDLYDPFPKAYCEIHTLEGTMRANDGDYIIRGVNGEIYPCKPDIFEKTYEPVGIYEPDDDNVYQYYYSITNKIGEIK